MPATRVPSSSARHGSLLPPRLVAWVAQARRDARMLLDNLRGRQPYPLIQRPRAGERAAQVPPVVEAERQMSRLGCGQPAARATVRVHLDGRVSEITVAPGETILGAALGAGLDMPFSCAMGGCGTCMLKRRAGAVDMMEPNCLTPDEREAGYVLACVGRPAGPATVEVEVP